MRKVTDKDREELWDSDLWFSLSYASWLVLPRIALQSMPEEWQNRFFGMVAELNEKIIYPDGYRDLDFTVTAKKANRFTKHVLPSYRHNDLPLKP